MTMNRRGFLAGIIAAASAPAIVRAGSIMQIATRQIWVPPQDVIASAYVENMTKAMRLWTVVGFDVQRQLIQARAPNFRETTEGRVVTTEIHISPSVVGHLRPGEKFTIAGLYL